MLSPGVIPNVNPTVAKAETTSKITSIKLTVYSDAKSDESNSSFIKLSDSNKAIVANTTINILIANTTIALLTALSGICF